MNHENHNPTKMAVMATLHCLLGCTTGEMLGVVITASPHRKTGASLVAAIVLAFFFGYLSTLWRLRRDNIGLKRAMKIALASDTVSITSMEIADNFVLFVLIPSALLAPVTSWLFWGSLAISMAAAFVVTVPVNRWLIMRGKGHAVMPMRQG